MDTQERGRADRAEATRKIREADREVVRIYQKALDDMTRKARAAGEGTAGRRWAEEMQRTYKRRISEMAGDIEGTITSAMQETAKIPAKSGAERISEIYSKAGGRLSAETFSDMYARVPEEAIRAVISGRAYLDGKSLSGRIWTQAGRLEGGINEIIKQGLAQQKSTAEIARELEQYVNPNAHETIAERRERVKRQAALPFAGNIEYNCQRLARTSINHAFFLATKEYAALSPFCKAIHWELSDDHFTRQVLPFGADICDEYATHDEGLGIGNWPVEGVPLPHAQCLCCQWPEEGGTLEECAERLGAWLSGNEDAGLDKAYGQWKDAMISGLPNARLGEIRDDAGDERARMLKQIAGREDVKALSVSERERLFNELNNVSNKELLNFQSSAYRMANGNRASNLHTLTGDEIENLKNDIAAIEADESVFLFNAGRQTAYIDEIDIITVAGDVLPDLTSEHPRDRMSPRAVLAHEYYGHRAHRNTKLAQGAWNDEFRASYTAAIKAPGLSDDDRSYLMLDAMERAKLAGVNIKINAVMRRIIYGY